MARTLAGFALDALMLEFLGYHAASFEKLPGYCPVPARAV